MMNELLGATVGVTYYFIPGRGGMMGELLGAMMGVVYYFIHYIVPIILIVGVVKVWRKGESDEQYR